MYKVLLVDDEPAMLEMEKRVIKSHCGGFEVVAEAYSVQQAIERFHDHSPDVILTDIRMSGRSGIELIRYIGELEENNTVCVSVSGYSDFQYVHDAFLYGAFDYLLKPIEPGKVGELFRRIEKLFVSSAELRSQPPILSGKPSSGELVSLIEQHLAENLAEDNSILAICSKFGISQPTLSKIFKKQKNLTYNEYLINLRIEEAMRLLARAEDYLISDVAEACGFSDQFYFSRVFKSVAGCTPRDYRKKVKAD